MNWHNFIFSDKRSVRLRRHLVFWLLWWFYFIITYFYYLQIGLQKIEFESWNVPFFIKSLLLLSIHILSCYCFIGFLLPRYLLKGKYLATIIGTVILCAVILLASFYLHKVIFPLINSAFNYNPLVASRNIWWTSISSGLFSAPKVIAIAMAIKLLKRWYLKQKEKERLEKEKLITDLQLLKAQIHPEFLFTTLDSVYQFAIKDSSRAATLLLKLSDLLSYILYESDKVLVPLNKEIKIIKDYMALEKARMGDQLEMDIAVKGEAGGKMIPPLLLLPFIENSLSYCYNKHLETCWINLELRFDGNELSMKLINGKSIESLADPINENGLINVQKRLEIMYPGNYRFKTNIEPEIVMTYLKIVLKGSMDENGNSFYNSEQNTYATT